MTRNIHQIGIILILVLALSACQQQPTKPTDDSINSMEWTQLQQSTLNLLREKNYGQALLRIERMMEVAGSSNENWEYIRMALISLPKDLSSPLIAKALENEFIAETAEELFAFSRVQTQRESLNEALDLVNAAIKKDREEPYVFWRARLHLMQENAEEAEKDYVWLIKQNPEKNDYLIQYASLLNYQGRLDEALKVLSSRTGDLDLTFREVLLLLQNDQVDIAKTKFAELKTLLDSGEELTSKQALDMGELAYWIEDLTVSESLLQQVKSGEHLNAAKLLLGRVYMEQGDDERAAVIFRQVQNGPEAEAIPAYQLGMEIYRQRGDYEQALDVANNGLRMFKNEPGLLYARAMIFEQMNDVPSLERDLMTIINNDPDNADAHNALGYTWVERDMKLEAAAYHILKAHELDPENKAILDSVGWLYYKQGNLEQAEHYLRLATADNLNDIEAFEHLIMVLKALEKNAEVQQLKTQAKKLFPDTSFD